MNSILFFFVVFLISTVKSTINKNDYAFIVQKGNRVDCITKGSSAMSWIRNLEDSKNSVSVFIPVIDKSFDCKILKSSKCTSFWTKSSWKLHVYDTGDINDIVLDRRWEGFHMIESAPINNSVKWLFSGSESSHFSIAVSIRAKCEAYIYICNEVHAINDTCYWINLQKCSSSLSSLQECIGSDTRTFNPEIESITCLPIADKKKKNVINENKWKHIKVMQEGSQLTVYTSEESKESSQLFAINDVEPKKTTRVIMTGKPILWKMLHFQYMVTNQTTTDNLGPELHTKNGTICIAMYVAMCRECYITLSLKDAFTNITYHPKIYASEVESLKWREIKYFVRNLPPVVLLYVSTNFGGTNLNVSKPLWAIDDVRSCQEVEYRAITANISSFKNSTINCQILSSGEMIELKSSVDAKLTLNNHCSEDTVGQFCIPRKYINFGNSEVGIKICENYQNRTVCSCSAGYLGNDCVKGFYGHECSKTCGNCKGTCDNIDGICDKCSDGFFGLKCNKSCSGGFYRSGCNEICAQCINSTCNNVDGTCSTCIVGFTGPKCDKPCPAGSYGQFCIGSCGTKCSSVCNHVNGNCSSCLDNFSGPKCEIEPFDMRLSYGLIALILLLILALILYLALRQKRVVEPKGPNKLLMRNIPNLTNYSLRFNYSVCQTTAEEVSKLPVSIDNFEQLVQNFENNDEMKREVQTHFKFEPTYCEISNLPGRIKSIDDSLSPNTYKVDGYNFPNAFIVITNQNLVNPSDFWKFVWDENIKNVVVLNNDTKAEEQFKNFFPKICKSFKGITVTPLSAYSGLYQIERRAEKSKVSCFEFTVCINAPPAVAAQNLTPILRVLLKMPLESHSPILICCKSSYAVGIILISDMSLRMASDTGSINIFKNFEQLRHQIFHFPNTFDSLKLTLVAILEYLTNFKHPLTCNNLVNLKNILNLDFVKLQRRCLKLSIENDKEKRVNNKIDPHPVFVDGFRTLKKFLVAEQPNEWISIDFWKTVISNDVTVIISLNEVSDESVTCALWPNEKYPVITPVSSVTIQHSQTSIFETYKITSLKMYRTQMDEERSLQIISLNNWRPGQLFPDDPVNFLKFRDQSEVLCRNAQPAMVTCRDGVTACGVYVALMFLVEKMKIDRIWDVATAVEIVRRNSKEFLIHEEQLSYLYEIATTFLKNFENYQNFK